MTAQNTGVVPCKLGPFRNTVSLDVSLQEQRTSVGGLGPERFPLTALEQSQLLYGHASQS
eukprot:1185945-Prorocentrum_minimum.AAC.5